MEISLRQAGKKFGRTWIFRGLDYDFRSEGKYAILGSNGSGKSTLLQILSAYTSTSAGKVIYTSQGKEISADRIFQKLTLATPYMELPEELTLRELLHFHAQFKQASVTLADIPHLLNLDKELDKEIKNFSSGMRQRVRLGLALLFHSELVLLDEPTTHLDHKATAWYQELLATYTSGKCLIISSNQPEEYAICEEHILIENYKKK